MKLLRLITAGLFVFLPFAASADPIVWTIDSSTGGLIYGEFTYDANTGIYSAIDVTGCCVEDYDIDNTASTIDLPNTNAGQLTLFGYIYPDALLMVWDSALTNSGGVIQGTWYELLNYNNSGLPDEQVSTTNYSYTGTLEISAIGVPEPGTLALLGIGLLGMGAARRRKKA